MTVTTALTAQNTQGVHGVHHTPPAFVEKQLHAVLSDIDVDVVKTGMLTSTTGLKYDFAWHVTTELECNDRLNLGMLASDATIHVVADSLKKCGNIRTVVDPVSCYI